jgi:hypothetical protein
VIVADTSVPSINADAPPTSVSGTSISGSVVFGAVVVVVVVDVLGVCEPEPPDVPPDVATVVDDPEFVTGVVVEEPCDATVVVGPATVVEVDVVEDVVVVATTVLIVIDVADVTVPGPVLDAASRTELAFRRATTVPSDEHVTLTVIEVLVDEPDGVNEHGVAVPVAEKSPAAIPDTGSEKVSV